jgi:hypothetical protein
MFSGCSSLVQINVSFTLWNDTATVDWVKGVASSGVFVKYDDLTVLEGQNAIPKGWTIKIKSRDD